jgi:hypothetical protein
MRPIAVLSLVDVIDLVLAVLLPRAVASGSFALPPSAARLRRYALSLFAVEALVWIGAGLYV